VNAEKQGTKIMKWGRSQPAIAYFSCVANRVFLTFSVFKFVHHEHLFAFSPSAMSVIPYSQERILGWPCLRLDKKCLSRLAEYDDVIRGAPF